MYRFFIQSIQIQDNQLTLSPDDFHHLVQVQRIRVGEKIELVVDESALWVVEITGIMPRAGIEFQSIQITPIASSSYPKIILAQGLPKQDKWSDILRACTEMGVDQFVPVLTARSISQPADTQKDRKLDRWNLIAKEAAQQSKRTSIPRILPICSFAEFIAHQTPDDLKLVLWEDEHHTHLRDVLSSKAMTSFSRILIFVGPEGGFSEAEIQICQTHWFIPVSIGESILRTEHAGFAAVAMVKYGL